MSVVSVSGYESFVPMYAVAVVCVLLIPDPKSLVTATITISVNPDLEQLNCLVDDGSPIVVCRNLDSAINYVSSLNDSSIASNVTEDSTKLLIPSGRHYITSQTDFGATNIDILGLDTDVTVVCDYYANESSFDPDAIHTWYFNHSASIVMMDVHFRRCGFPFRFVAVRNVEMRNCSFVNFSEAVLDIYNCQNVTLDHLSFRTNSGTGRLLESVRGNTGALAIGYSNLPPDYTNPTLVLSNSIFVENQATGFLRSEQAVTGQVFLGRGGGVGLFMKENTHELDITVSDCLFENNFARLFGGGLCMLTTSYPHLQHLVRIQRSRFIGNVGISGGGGVQLSFLDDGNVSSPHSFIFSDCLFERNRGTSGGGIYIFVVGNGNYARLEDCSFTDNGGNGTQDDLGAAIALSYLIRFAERVTSTHHEIINCTFERNAGPNGILSVGYAPLTLSGSNRFTRNRGSSLRIIGSLVDIESEVEFTENSANGEGALYLISYGQIRLKRGTHIIFSKNTGRLGSSIVVDTSSTLVTFDNLLYNPSCFINYEDRTVTPDEWKDVSILFRENSALVSSAVYLSQKSSICSWFRKTPPFFNNSYMPDWPLWAYENNVDTGYLDPSNQILSFGTTAQLFQSNTTSMEAWPGQNVNFTLISLDDFGHSTFTSARLHFRPNQTTQKNLTPQSIGFSPQIFVLADSLENDGRLLKTISFSYTIADSESLATAEEPLGTVAIEEPFNPDPVLSESFTLLTLPCPGGYRLVQSQNGDAMTCVCRDLSEEVVFCEDDQDSVVLIHGTWAAYNPNVEDTDINLFLYACPAGYCDCTFGSSLTQRETSKKECVYMYRHSDQDQQCKCGRKGILCGECINNTGVSVLLNRCVSCSDSFLLLIPLLIVLVVTVIIGIILLDRALPDWMLPFLFYIQSAPYATLYFPETFDYGGRYFHYLGSATGFYFIYDFCLSTNFTVLHSYLLCYLPSLVVLTVSVAMQIVRRKILKKKSFHNHGAWWCLLLLFSSVSHTSLSVFNCPSIQSETTSSSRLFESGDVECFTGGHIPLALLAMFMLVICLCLIVFVTVVPFTKLSRFKNYKEPFVAQYKSEVRYWSGVELARRFLLALAIVPYPRNSIYAILLLVATLSLYTYKFPYKTLLANIMELLLQLNFLVLLLLETMPVVRDELFVFSTDTVLSGEDCTRSFSDFSSVALLLLPIYYAPLFVLLMLATCHMVMYLYKTKRKKKMHEPTSSVNPIVYYMNVANDFTTQTLDITHSMEESTQESTQN